MCRFHAVLIVEVGVLSLARSAASVHLGSDGVSDVGELLLLLLKVLSGGIGAVLVKPLLSLLNGVDDGLLVLVVNLAAKTVLIIDLVLEAESVVLKTITGLNALTSSLVLLGVLLSLGNHALNLLRGETTLVVGDGDGLLLASALVVGRDLENTVGVKLERDLDLRNTTGSGRNAGKLELAENVIILGQGALTLQDLDENDGLVISGSRENLALAGRNRSVAGNQFGHDATGGLDTKSKGVDIHENKTFSSDLARQNTGLDSRAKGHGLIGVDTFGSLLAAKDNVVNLGLLDVGVLENLLNGLDGLLEEIHVKLLELGASQSLGEVVALEESLNLDAGAHLRRQSTLGLFSLTLELTHGFGVLGDVNIVLLVVGFGEEVDDALVEILTTKMGVTGGGKDLKDTIVDRQERDIKSTTTEIVDNDLALTVALVQTIGDGGGGGLVDDSENVETGDNTGVLGSLALIVLRRGLAVVTDEAFFGDKLTLNVEGVGGGLVLGGITNQTLLIGEGDVRRSDTVSLVVDENFDLATLHHTDARLQRGHGSAGRQPSARALRRNAYNTNDSAIIVAVGDLSVDSLDEGEGRKKERDPSQESEAKGHRTTGASHCGKCELHSEM
ncbi:NAD-specific glutamate dehydrogenase [Beauveria bassiana]|uniref:NAD-specific glutamate dehydrogenase n=1 Tax=Beauveria bassiana TaxID=176275 RepID=A0A2N6NCQ2_BEABA|nr:NAD-specific glutamate dehydrogenase [Beauveria bassiana]